MFDFDYYSPLWDDTVQQRTLLTWPSVILRDAVLTAVAHSAMAAAVSVRLTPHPGHLEIDLLAVGGGDRGHGLGSWTLRRLCALADFYRVDLGLEVSCVPALGSPCMTDEQLEHWYGRYGFVRDDFGSVKRMLRRHL